MKPNLQHAIERVERPGGSHEGVGRKKQFLTVSGKPRNIRSCKDSFHSKRFKAFEQNNFVWRFVVEDILGFHKWIGFHGLRMRAKEKDALAEKVQKRGWEEQTGLYNRPV